MNIRHIHHCTENDHIIEYYREIYPGDDKEEGELRLHDEAHTGTFFIIGIKDLRTLLLKEGLQIVKVL